VGNSDSNYVAVISHLCQLYACQNDYTRITLDLHSAELHEMTFCYSNLRSGILYGGRPVHDSIRWECSSFNLAL
jgi:hypothetical protein